MDYQPRRFDVAPHIASGGKGGFSDKSRAGIEDIIDRETNSSWYSQYIEVELKMAGSHP